MIKSQLLIRLPECIQDAAGVAGGRVQWMVAVFSA